MGEQATEKGPSCPIAWRDRQSISGLPGGSAGKESACNAGDLGLILGLGRSLGEGNSYPLQYSGLENSMACRVHGVSTSRTRLSDFPFHFFGDWANNN